jgi:hypothetical protein
MRAPATWCAALVTAVGYYSVLTGSAFELHWVLAYTLMLGALWSQLRHGWASPLGLFLVFALLRFAVPGVAASVSEIPAVGLFEMLRLTEVDWWTGHSLALLGITSVVCGWLAMPSALAIRLFGIVDRLESGASARQVLLNAVLLSGIGLAALITFVSFNASGAATETVVAGTFRSEQVIEGTGIFFHLALALIAGSVLQAATLRSLRFSAPVAMLPAVLAGLAFFVLGGRARAMTPIFAGLVALTAENRQWREWLRTPAWYAGGVMAILVVGAVGHAYRGDYGITAFWSLDDFLPGYIDYAIWFDVGQLHSLAAVVKLEPGILGRVVWVAAFGSVGPLIGWQGRSSGVFIVESLTSDLPRKWGVHSTLIGDSYLSIGLIGVVAVCFVFGAWLQALHAWRWASPRRNPLAAAVYGLAVVYSLRVFFESLEKIGEMQLIAAVVVVAGLMARRSTPVTEDPAASNYPAPARRRR